MKIYLTRHSKTVWNEEKRLQGRLDSPLTKEGLENVFALKKHIQDMHFDYVFSSPIKRAFDTASLLFDETSIIKDERLMEMNFGILEGQKISEILKTNHDLYYDLWHRPEVFTIIPGGESYDDVILRVKNFLNDIQKLDEDSHIMIVTHGMLFIVLLATMLGYEKKDFVLLNQKVVEGCSLTIVTYQNNEFCLEKYNQCDYLPHIMNASFAK